MDSAASGTLMSERASIGSRDPSMYTISPVTPTARKVRCGQRHFEALGVPFAVAITADEV